MMISRRKLENWISSFNNKNPRWNLLCIKWGFQHRLHTLPALVFDERPASNDSDVMPVWASMEWELRAMCKLPTDDFAEAM